MTLVESSVASSWVDAIVAQDITRAVALLHPDVDFRAMTPNRVWEPEGRAGVEAVLREWFEDPDEVVNAIEATQPAAIEGTLRVGWLVHISDGEGPHVFEQQAYVREREGQIDWVRAICSGWIPLGGRPSEPLSRAA
jgi:hypothetical protein